MPMRSRVFTDPRQFLERMKPLLADEARDNLILGITRTMVSQPERFKDAILYTVERNGHPAASALITPPHDLLVSPAADGDAIRDLARAVHDHGVTIPGVTGERGCVETFKDAWSDLTSRAAVLEMEQGIFSLESVREVPAVAGDFRRATAEDFDLVVDWMLDFVAEAIPRGVEDVERVAALASRRLTGGLDSGFWLWEVDTEPVAISGHTSPTGSGIRVNGVYTPRDLRRNGYATALVAHQSQWLLDNGYRSCFLYTDLANPTSNDIYRRIGYQQVAESAMYRFE